MTIITTRGHITGYPTLDLLWITDELLEGIDVEWTKVHYST